MGDLSTVEKFMLAELLSCGAIDHAEFCKATRFKQHGTGVRDTSLSKLKQKGFIQYTLYKR